MIFIAPPAAGKGTICDMLEEKYNIAHISAGDVLRSVIKEQTEIGIQIEEQVNNGQMIDDFIMKDLIEQKLKNTKLNSFIMDGYPRKLCQVNDYESILKKLNLLVDKVIFINLDEETGLKRILGRLTCPKCKRNYNNLTGYATPKNEGLCDYCNIKLTKREDDKIESYKRRYKTFIDETLPVIEYYKKQGLLYEVDGNLTPIEIFEKIESILGV